MTVEELNAKVAELTGQLTSANALVASEKARADGLQTQLDAEKTAHSTTKAALVTATDESIVVGGQTISKSAVGDAQFTVMKALHEESATTRFEKRAELEFAHVTGTPAEKAAVLKHLDTLPADNAARKAAEAILTSAEKMAKAGFANLGSSNDRTPSAKQAQVDFEGKVEEIMARDKLTKVKAMSKARREFPELFAEMQGN